MQVELPPAGVGRAWDVELDGTGSHSGPSVIGGCPLLRHDGRTTRHVGYSISQRIRKRIEEAYGWIKTVAGQDKTRFRGVDRVAWAFRFTAAAYNLVRLPKLLRMSPDDECSSPSPTALLIEGVVGCFLQTQWRPLENEPSFFNSLLGG